MSILHEGRGTLLDRTGQMIRPVAYSFFIEVERGIMGSIWSDQKLLPRVTTLRLLLADGTHFVAIWVGSPWMDRARDQYRFVLYAAPDQPDDPNNLVRQRPTLPPH